MNEQEHSSFWPSQDNELRVWAFRRSMFSRRIAEAEDLLQLLTTMSCGQNCFSNVDMPMKLTAHWLYSIEFPSDRTARNSWEASKQLGNQDVSYKSLIRKLHLQRVTLGQWTRFSRVRNVWDAARSHRFRTSFQWVFCMIILAVTLRAREFRNRVPQNKGVNGSTGLCQLWTRVSMATTVFAKLCVLRGKRIRTLEGR